MGRGAGKATGSSLLLRRRSPDAVASPEVPGCLAGNLELVIPCMLSGAWQRQSLRKR